MVIVPSPFQGGRGGRPRLEYRLRVPSASDRRAVRLRGMSAMPPVAPKLIRLGELTRCAKQPDSCTAANSILFDHLVGAGEQRGWNGNPEYLRGPEIDDEFELGRLQYG